MHLYTYLVSGRDIQLPELQLEYSTYAQTQIDKLNNGEYAQTKHYWTQQLQGIPATHDLQLDGHRPRIQSYQGTTQRSNFGKARSARLAGFCKKHKITEFIFLQAVFSTLLHRFSGNLRSDIVMGTPVANRPLEQLVNIVGCFINTLVLRNQISADMLFSQHLESCATTVLRALSHQAYPFEVLVDNLQPERSTSQHPVYQILFSFHNYEEKALQLPGLDIETMEIEDGLAKFDLSVNMRDTAAGLRAEWEYNTDLFQAASIAQLAQCFEVLIDSVLENPHTKIGELRIQNERQKQELLYEFNDTFSKIKEPIFFKQFEKQAHSTPNAIALRVAEKSFSYAQLNQAANQLAHHLLASGTQTGQRISILLERGFDLLVSLLAVQKTGAIYVPLDPGYPKQRLEFMLQDSASVLIISKQHLLTAFDFKQTLPVLDLEQKAVQIQAESDSDLNVDIDENDPVYTLYSSGSSGQPKGITVSQRNLGNFLQTMQQQPGFESHDRLLAVTPYSFDISGLEFYLPLFCGGQLVLASEADAISPQNIAELLTKK